MALIICTECGKEFSDKAKACPNCGCPTEFVVAFKTEPQLQTATPDQSQDYITEAEVASNSPKTRSKENLLSYYELRNFSFSSVLPYINKELNGTITDVHRGTGERDDAHYYIICGKRIIGIKLVIDAYPDVYNVGRFFGDDINEQALAKDMHEHGYECAVARIGIGAQDHVRFARRIFQKNDGYYFNYQQLSFVKYNPQSTQITAPSGIRYSLSDIPPDESWKKIAGFEYTKPQKHVSPYAIQKPEAPKDYARIRAIDAFWDDGYNTLSKVEQMCLNAYIDAEDAAEMSQLICYGSSVTHEKVDPGELTNYICNAVDFVTGMFLSDSVSVAHDEILLVLRELIGRTELVGQFELECDEIVMLTYLIYIFVTDRAKFKEYLQGDYLAEYKGKRLSSIGYIYHSTKDAFLANPGRFGYGQSVVNEVARLKNINSKQNIDKFATLRAAQEAEMRQFCGIHDRIVNKKTLQQVGTHEKELLRKFSENVYQLRKFVQSNFDEKLSAEYRTPMDAFMKIVAAYYRCIGMDEVIVDRQLRGKYGMFERLDDAKESQTRFEQFSALYSK